MFVITQGYLGDPSDVLLQGYGVGVTPPSGGGAFGGGRSGGADTGKPVFSERERERRRTEREREELEKRWADRKKKLPPRITPPAPRKPLHREYAGIIDFPAISALGLSSLAIAPIHREATGVLDFPALAGEAESSRQIKPLRFSYESAPIMITADDGDYLPPMTVRTFSYDGTGEGFVKRKKPMQLSHLAMIDPDLAELVDLLK